MTSFLALLITAQAQTWPADEAWVPVPIGGAAVQDPSADDIATGALDVVGDAADPAASWAADEQWLYVRLQVDADPLAGPDDLGPGVWELALDTDGDDLVDAAVAVDGTLDTVDVFALASPSGDLGYTGTGLDTEPVANRARVTGAGPWTVDLVVPLGLALPSPQAPFRAIAFTRPNPSAAPGDVAGCDGPCIDLATAWSDPVAIDADADGLTASQEAALGLDPEDADSDDDGVLDGEEPSTDTDGDGLWDALDCDSDDDGLLDGTELGLFRAGLSPDTDVRAGCWAGDADTTNPITDPRSEDTDGGGLPDGIEDFDRDGAQDTWETDPNDPADDVDTDGDGIADAIELLAADGAIDDADSDGDGIPDLREGLEDRDGDGTPNFADLDSDGDNIDDAVEGDNDTDGDGVANYRDTDSDGDGSRDREELDGDTDGDGTPDFLDLDSDGDGIRDEVEGRGDYDGDGLPNRVDLDSDDDGIPDEIEGTTDTDRGGSPNYLDGDSDNDGIEDFFEGYDDVDGDGDPNYVDTNADGTGPSDGVEGIADVDCDGTPNFLDPDDEDGFCEEPPPEPGFTGTGAAPIHEETAKPGAGHFTGGSCSTVPGTTPWAGLVVALLAGLRRRTPWLLLAPAAAGAQEIDAQRFTPVVDGGPLVKVVDGRIEPGGHVGVWMDRAHDPLVFRSATGDEVALLGRVDTAHLVGSGSAGIVRIGAEVPVHLVRDGLGLDRTPVPGDSRLSGELRLFESEGLSAGLWGDAIVPTGARGTWLSAGTFAARGGAAIAYARGPALVALNAGGRSGTGASLGSLTSRPGPIGGLGLAWRFSHELAAAIEIDREDWLDNTGEPGAHPMEWLASVRATSEQAALQLGLGTGLGSGVGAPDFRMVAGLTVRIPSADEDPTGG